MSRIRSLHPTQWTDEEFVDCSPLARLLALGLRNEADDGGVFEWKPTQIKMRILPADECDVRSLLVELISSRQVAKYEISGKWYGKIRNFERYQSSKHPKYLYPQPTAETLFVSEVLEDIGNGESREYRSEISPNKPLLMSDVMGGCIGSETPSPNGEAPFVDEPALAVAEWNTLADELGLARVQRMTLPRKRALPHRLRECDGLTGWKAALAKIRGSPFLLNADSTNRGDWRIDFDFLMQPKSFTKLMEGAYDAKPRNGKPAKPTLADDARAIAESLGLQPGRMDDFADPAGGTVLDNADTGGLGCRAAA